ncbi:putative glutamate synthase subunit beta [Solibacillus isronensis B3W22]|uniref:Putative glutamate synthase subunit beta n=1 Tax=Solibacillus isronensis B3W22 TaxID=1224748 RepID=K1KWZ7_9BACL|nr:NAD(P)-binding domain-containing protein [Solibacillus isronensis]AMO85516.1 flavoprotein [Solibacillus silvestris]EKB44412.1 putative glutamate synthase subunit beta [Solibacillus isronensis B3W22]
MNIPLTIKNQNSSCCAPVSASTNSCCGPVEGTQNESLPKESPTRLNKTYPVAIIGAGPVGLAAAAHLSLAGEAFILLEKSSEVAENIKSWQHVRLFSPWQYNVDKAAKQLLLKSGWTMPEESILPTGQEIRAMYLQPLANLPEIKPFISFNTTVFGISKKNRDKMKSASRDSAPFVLYTEQNGKTERIFASAVIDATGTWATPNPVHAENVWTSAEQKLADKIFYGIPNVKSLNDRYKGKRVAVIGGGHSAINTILELEKLEDVEIIWVLRKKRVEEAYGGEEKDALAARGELGSRIHTLVNEGKIKVFTPFYIEELTQTSVGIIIKGDGPTGEHQLPAVDEIIANTGSRPDFSFLKEIRLSIDSTVESVEALAPLIDPNEHSCGTVRPHGELELRHPESGFYIVGMKSYGRAPTFLMATGYEQVRSIVAYLTGDLEAARKVELDLPETGVCSLDLNSNNNSNCC